MHSLEQRTRVVLTNPQPSTRRGYILAAVIGAVVALVALGALQLITGDDGSAPPATPLRTISLAPAGYPAIIDGWHTEQPLGAAIKALGEATTLEPGTEPGGGCTGRWDSLQMTAHFYNLGGADACALGYGHLSYALMRGPHWQTAEGLKIGDSVGRLRQLYPRAKNRVGSGPQSIDVRGWLLFPYFSRVGDGGWASLIVAVVDDGRVTAFRVDAYAGGE